MGILKDKEIEDQGGSVTLSSRDEADLECELTLSDSSGWIRAETRRGTAFLSVLRVEELPLRAARGHWAQEMP